MRTHSYTSVFLKMWFAELLQQNPLVFLLKCGFQRPTLELWNQNIPRITSLNTQWASTHNRIISIFPTRSLRCWFIFLCILPAIYWATVCRHWASFCELDQNGANTGSQTHLTTSTMISGTRLMLCFGSDWFCLRVLRVLGVSQRSPWLWLPTVVNTTHLRQINPGHMPGYTRTHTHVYTRTYTPRF